MPPATLCELFCIEYQCAPEDFEERVFWHCLHARGVFWARLLWRLNRGLFDPDFDLIRQVKTQKDLAGVKSELVYFRDRHPPAGLFRGRLRVRLSGERLLDLAGELFRSPQTSSHETAR
jgi:hypothetical protein